MSVWLIIIAHDQDVHNSETDRGGRSGDAEGSEVVVVNERHSVTVRKAGEKRTLGAHHEVHDERSLSEALSLSLLPAGSGFMLPYTHTHIPNI